DILRRNVDDGRACRKIVGRTLEERDLLAGIACQVRDDWRYLERDCELSAAALEEWRRTAAIRRTVQFVGQWIGINVDPARLSELTALSMVKQIKAGAKTEAAGAWSAQYADLAR